MGANCVLPSLFQFGSYREYLKQFYEYSKKVTPGFSYAYFSNRAGLPSPNYLQMIMTGRRNLTVDNIHRFATALDFGEEEREFFEALVHWEQTEEPTAKKFYRVRLDRLRKNLPETRASTRANALFREWYHPVVWVAAEGKTRDEVVELGGSLKLSPDQMTQALDQLGEEGLLIENAESKYQLVADHLQARDSGSMKLLQRDYLGKQLDLSKWAWRHRYGKEGVFLSHTFTLDVEDYGKFSSQMTEFLSSLVAQADQKKSNNISQINVQMFSLSGQNLNNLFKEPEGSL
ncbi:MAG: TIGR02147 family protein [Bdellovibrionales bacterium]|nr:TIGR02147 family protein [Bdellovibrionales bacterium]